jgi:hypothetical protein
MVLGTEYLLAWNEHGPRRDYTVKGPSPASFTSTSNGRLAPPITDAQR